MRALIQRVQHAKVEVDQNVVGQIQQGLLVFLGVFAEDSKADAEKLARRVAGYRVFADADGKTNLALADVAGAALVVSQFTLAADTRKGRRPSFSNAAAPETAEYLYQQFADALREHDIPVETGIFQADMQVSLVNDGPMTFLLET